MYVLQLYNEYSIYVSIRKMKEEQLKHFDILQLGINKLRNSSISETIPV